jgi:hypothetical protein
LLNTSPLVDPLANWPNNDLLLTQESRDRLEATRPRLLRVFDWPELRQTFELHDRPAIRWKRWNHRQGVGSVLFTGLGLILLSTSPIVPLAAQELVINFALFFMAVGGLMGVLHWGLLRSRHSWLGHRFWTERLRQLHFQALINNLQLAAGALSDDEAYARLVDCRRRWLADWYSDPDDPRARIRAILRDQTEARTWARHEWETAQPLTGSSPQIDEILEGLYQLRLGIQATYAEKNLGPDVYSPPTRSIYLRKTVDLCYLLVALIAAATVASVLAGQALLGFSVPFWTSLAGAVSAVGLIAQSINQGLQNEAELDRYEWYAEEVGQSKAAYERGDRSARIDALRRLEQASYRELRLFLRAHSAARFTR